MKIKLWTTWIKIHVDTKDDEHKAMILYRYFYLVLILMKENDKYSNRNNLDISFSYQINEVTNESLKHVHQHVLF